MTPWIVPLTRTMHYIESLFPEEFLIQIWVVLGCSHFLSNALSPNFFFHNIAIINPLDIFLLLICRRQHWPVKTHVPTYQIVYKGYVISISTMNILNMSFNTTFPWGIHTAANARPVWFSQLISQPSFVCIQKSRSATQWSIIRHCIRLHIIM